MALSKGWFTRTTQRRNDASTSTSASARRRKYFLFRALTLVLASPRFTRTFSCACACIVALYVWTSLKKAGLNCSPHITQHLLQTANLTHWKWTLRKIWHSQYLQAPSRCNDIYIYSRELELEKFRIPRFDTVQRVLHTVNTAILGPLLWSKWSSED